MKDLALSDMVILHGYTCVLFLCAYLYTLYSYDMNVSNNLFKLF